MTKRRRKKQAQQAAKQPIEKTVLPPEKDALDHVYGREWLNRYERGIDGTVNQFEFIRELSGPNRFYCYREMGKNDPLSSAALKMIQLLIRAVDWQAKPAVGGAAASDDAAQLLDECRNDMQTSWRSFLVQASSLITYGFAVHEIGFKVRAGTGQGNPFFCSAHNDFKYGWLALPQRSPFSIDRWDVDEKTGVLRGVYQRVETKTGEQIIKIPANRLIHFKTSADSSPEGESWLRGGYVSYRRQCNYEAWRDISIKRDMAGTPIVYMPADKLGDPAYRQRYGSLVAGLHRGERAGLLFPAKYEKNIEGRDCRTGWDFELLKSSSNGAYDIGQTIKDLWQERAMSMLTQSQMLGTRGHGSNAQSVDQTNMLKDAIEALLKEMSDIFHKQATIPLMLLNEVRPENMPKLVPQPLRQQSLDAFAHTIAQLATPRLIRPTIDVVNHVHQKAGLPAVSQEDYDMIGEVNEEMPAPVPEQDT